jgi:hypothetical protein
MPASNDELFDDMLRSVHAPKREKAPWQTIESTSKTSTIPA